SASTYRRARVASAAGAAEGKPSAPVAASAVKAPKASADVRGSFFGPRGAVVAGGGERSAVRRLGCSIALISRFAAAIISAKAPSMPQPLATRLSTMPRCLQNLGDSRLPRRSLRKPRQEQRRKGAFAAPNLGYGH